MPDLFLLAFDAFGDVSERDANQRVAARLKKIGAALFDPSNALAYRPDAVGKGCGRRGWADDLVSDPGAVFERSDFGKRPVDVRQPFVEARAFKELDERWIGVHDFFLFVVFENKKSVG